MPSFQSLFQGTYLPSLLFSFAECTRDTIVEREGHNALISLVLVEEPSLQVTAAKALARLAEDGTPLPHPLPLASIPLINIYLSIYFLEKYQRKVAQSGALMPLLMQLGSPSVEVQEYAAKALANLAENSMPLYHLIFFTLAVLLSLPSPLHISTPCSYPRYSCTFTPFTRSIVIISSSYSSFVFFISFPSLSFLSFSLLLLFFFSSFLSSSFFADENQAKICGAGGIRSLYSLLTSKDPGVLLNITKVLANLSSNRMF